jgi:hypothetical protein
MPHPIIISFRGVTVDKGRVLELLFDRYDMSPDDMVRHGHHIDIPEYLLRPAKRYVTSSRDGLCSLRHLPR